MRDGGGNTAFHRYLRRDIPSLFGVLRKLQDASWSDVQAGPANGSSCWRHFALNRLGSLLFRRCLRRPFNWRVLQAAFDQLASKTIGVVPDRAPCHELMVVNSIGFDLPPDVFVKKRQAFVRHMFDTHDEFLNSNDFGNNLLGPTSRVQLGGLSSPASQPGASVFKGSTAKLVFSMRWHVLHSNVRSS